MGRGEGAESARARGLRALGFAVLFGLVALFAYAPISSVDFHWLLKLGEIIATEREIPSTDLFSAVHPDRPYVQFQWLWELLAYAAFRVNGLAGVRGMQALVLVISFAVLARATLRLFGRASLAFAFCALALVLFEDRFRARPSATLLGFVASVLPLLLGEFRTADRRTLAFVFAIGCLWSNIHGGESLLFVLCLGAVGVGSWLEARLGTVPRAEAQRALWVLLAGSLGVICSPTLLRGLADWAVAIGPQIESGNQEWQPSYTMLEHGLTPSLLLVGLGPSFVALAYAVEQWQRQRGKGLAAAPWAEWLLCAGLLVLAHHAVRNAFLCLIPLAFMLRRLSARALSARSLRLSAALGVALLGAAFHDHVVDGYGGLRDAAVLMRTDLLANTFPDELATFMREAEIEGGILNDGRWGGFLIWELWPRCHVFVDSRHDLSEPTWPVFMASQAPRTRGQALDYAFTRWGVELSAFRGPTFPAVVAPAEWQLLYKAGDQELYQHIGGRHARQNMERAFRWLTARAGAARSFDRTALAQLAVDVGAERWLRGPYQRYRADKALRLRQSGAEAEVREGLALESALLFEAGSYGAALSVLAQILNQVPEDEDALYRTALASVAVGDLARARQALDRLKPRLGALSGKQRGRLVALDQALSPNPAHPAQQVP